jgi:hypothetical protein
MGKHDRKVARESHPSPRQEAQRERKASKKKRDKLIDESRLAQEYEQAQAFEDSAYDRGHRG